MKADGLRVLFVITSLGYGGTERSTAQLLPELRALGIDCEIAVLKTVHSPDEGRLLDDGFVIHTIANKSLMGRSLEIRRLIRDRKPDIVHTAIFDADLAGRIGAWRSGAVVVSSLVNTSYDPARIHDSRVPLWKLRLAQAADAATARYLTTSLHAVSGGVARANSRDLRLPLARIRVVERGRDPALLPQATPARRHAARAALGIDDASLVLLAIGRHEYQKGHVHLVEATKILAALPETSDVITLIAGRDGNASADLRSAITKAAMTGRVRLLGQREDVPELLAAADFLVLPSLYEGTAGVVIEAMATGTPIVATHVDGLEGILTDRGNAVQCPPGDPVALAHAIRTAHADPDLCERLTRQARFDFMERFTLEGSAQRMLDYYRNLVGVSMQADKQANCVPS